MNFSTTVNIIIAVVFTVLAVLMFYRCYKYRGKVLIQDQQWSVMRMMFLAFGLLAVFSLLFSRELNTTYDYARLIATILAVSAYMLMRDGVGEEGMMSGGKFYPWTEVRSYDYEERKNVIAVYFTLESQKENKPDEYTTKELDFAKEDKEYIMKFLDMNLGRKYTRMKKKSKKK